MKTVDQGMTITLLSPQDVGVTAQRSVTQCMYMAYIRTLRNACSKHPFNTLQQVLWQILNQRIKALETEIKKRLCTEHFKKIQLSGYASPHCT